MPIVVVAPHGKPQAFGAGQKAAANHLFAARKDIPYRMVDLGGHKLNGVTYNENDPDTSIEVELRNGLWRQTEVSDPADIESISATLRFPQSLWSPVDDIAEYGNDCYVLIVLPECPDPCSVRWEVFETKFGRSRKLDKFVGYGDDGSVIDREAPVTMPAFYEQFALMRFSTVETEGAEFWGLDFTVQGCPAGCGSDNTRDGFVYGLVADGEDDDPALYSTDDAFANLSLETTGIATGNVITSGFSNDSIHIIGFASDGLFTASTTGGLRYTIDGTTWVAGINTAGGAAITTPIHSIVECGSFWLAVGGPDIWKSFDGKEWTEVPNSVTTPKFSKVAYDAENLTAIIGGASTTNDVTLTYVDGILEDISADTGATGAVHTVGVLGDGHWFVGAAAGQVRETFDGGGSWVGGVYGSDPVGAVAGNTYYTLMAVGNVLYQRNPSTSMDFQVVVTGETLVGDITAIAVALSPYGYIKRARAVTDAGEILFMEDCKPDLAALIEG